MMRSWAIEGNQMSHECTKKEERTKGIDWVSNTMLGFMGLMVLLCVVVSWRMIDTYRDAFGGRLLPKTVAERTAPTQSKEETAKDEHANSIEARAELGQLGDYFGGTLNPLFGFVSVIALLLTIIYQARELKQSREELQLSRIEMEKSSEALGAQNSAIEHQRFEQTFFAWLGTYRELLESTEEARKRSDVLFEYRGRRALKYWWEQAAAPGVVLGKLRAQLGDPEWVRLSRPNEPFHDKFIRLSAEGWKGALSKNSLEQWESLYADAEYQLDSLFRVLFNLLRWINSQSSEQLSNAQKWQYVSIVRAQLSWIELVYLFCNGHTLRGEKFKELAERYALFDNLPFHTNPVILVMKECPPDGGRGYADTAYSSTLARHMLGLPESAEATLALAAKGPHQVVP